MKKILMIALLLLPSLTGAQILVDVPFDGTCLDAEDGDISASLVWTSDVSGQIGTGASGVFQLPEGVHVITATCDDSGPTPPQSASVTITVDVDDPPTVTIQAPVDGSTHTN